ncbi:unnamed protein product [Amoebophrya sp. A120]|nr:unnamed protein product [Amoebophrya sp. A120]|eukprot:GSA120T00020953001.1
MSESDLLCSEEHEQGRPQRGSEEHETRFAWGGDGYNHESETIAGGSKRDKAARARFCLLTAVCCLVFAGYVVPRLKSHFNLTRNLLSRADGRNKKHRNDHADYTAHGGEEQMKKARSAAAARNAEQGESSSERTASASTSSAGGTTTSRTSRTISNSQSETSGPDQKTTELDDQLKEDISLNDDALRYLCGGQSVFFSPAGAAAPTTPTPGTTEMLYFALPFGKDLDASFGLCWEHFSAKVPALDWEYFEGIFNSSPVVTPEEEVATGKSRDDIQSMFDTSGPIRHWYPFQEKSRLDVAPAAAEHRAAVDGQVSGVGAVGSHPSSPGKRVVDDAVQLRERKTELLDGFRMYPENGITAMYVLLIDPQTQKVVWHATWQHPENDFSFRTGYLWTLQTAKAFRGRGLCKAGVQQTFAVMQRLYNSPRSAKYLQQVFPKEYETNRAQLLTRQARDDPADETHFLKKLLITDGSWLTVSYDFKDWNEVDTRLPTQAELAAQRWLPPGHRAMAPGVLENTIWKYTKDEPFHLYLIDNYAPVDLGAFAPAPVVVPAAPSTPVGPTEQMKDDENRKDHDLEPEPTAAVMFQAVKNHPQPIDGIANTFACPCYRAPWKEGNYGEPALLLSSFGPQKIGLEMQKDAVLLATSSSSVTAGAAGSALPPAGRGGGPDSTNESDVAVKDTHQMKTTLVPDRPDHGGVKLPIRSSSTDGDSDIVTETVQDWRPTYVYDMPKFGATTVQQNRLPAIPETDWVTNDESVLPQQQETARELQRRAWREAEVAREAAENSFAGEEHAFLTAKNAGPETLSIYKPAGDAVKADKQAMNDFLATATPEQLRQVAPLSSPRVEEDGVGGRGGETGRGGDADGDERGGPSSFEEKILPTVQVVGAPKTSSQNQGESSTTEDAPAAHEDEQETATAPGKATAMSKTSRGHE